MMCTAADIEGVRRAHHGPDVEVVFPVLDGDLQRMTPGIELGDDRVHRPIAETIDHVPAVAVGQQLRIEALIVRPRERMRTDPDLTGRGRDLVFA